MHPLYVPRIRRRSKNVNSDATWIFQDDTFTTYVQLLIDLSLSKSVGR